MSIMNRQPSQSVRSHGLSRLLYALRLVPEAPLLAGCLVLAQVAETATAFSMIGLGLAFWFVLRMVLLLSARHALSGAAYQRAEALAAIAERMWPWSADTLALVGTLQLARNQAEQAVSTFQRAIRQHPQQAMLYVALATAQLEADEPLAARESARTALGLDRSCSAAYLAAATAERACNTEPAQIEALLRTGLSHAQSPADEGALQCELAEQLLRSERIGEARMVLSRTEGMLARCAAPQRAGLHFRLGELLQQVGEIEPARRHFSASEVIDPSGPYAADAWRAARS